MPSIRLLPEQLRNLIAAGEVIERPASVVKELVENSIDAGAANITIELLYGGKKLIRVTDDGSGMDREDALLSIERYATSKISEIDDLFNLRTLGFRGEALASISAVSRITIETGTDISSPGTVIEVTAGEVKSIRDSPPLRGTVVTVRDLFFNTPARRKFLKANSTELNYILETVVSEALGNFKPGFKVFADNSELLFLPAVYEARERIAQVFGMEVLEHMEEFEEEAEDIRLHAFISRPPELRTKKTGQYLFVNQRPVKDPVITKAIYDGLSDLLPQGRHPLFVVYLTINPSKVDFNVHPTKREIRFSDGSLVYEFVKSAVERACVKRITEIHFEANPSSKENLTISERITGTEEYSARRLFESTPEDFSKESEEKFLSLGDLFVVKAEHDGLLIMDKHACHERVLYEKFLSGGFIQKRLLFPKQVRLPQMLYMCILKNKELLREMGFEIDDFGSGSLLVRTVPEFYDLEDLDTVLNDMASILLEHERGMASKEEIQDRRNVLAMSLACHKSIRGKERLNPQELKTLYRELLNTSDPYHCPHGRPALIKLTMEELLKKFRRT